MSTTKTFVLSPSEARLEYLAEGAANVIYRILPPNSDPSTLADLHSENGGYDSDAPLPTEIPPLQLDPSLLGKLVRLRKNLPSTAPVADSQNHFENMIRPLFRNENLVESTLFQPARESLKDCNSNLRKMERNCIRPIKRHGTYLAEDEKHGCLITDMSSLDKNTFKCFEFKPKWLVQSPSAPAGARRCRTCALRAMKRANKSDTPDMSKAAFCPLNLVSIDKAKLAIFVDHILGMDPGRDRSRDNGVSLTEHGLLMRFLYKNPLLDKLRDLQLNLDPNGVFKADLMSPKFLAAMTLRDCTLYLRVSFLSQERLVCGLMRSHKIPMTGHTKVEARLGDLDLKTSGGKKAEYWRNLERRLIDEGWYSATENDNSGGENFCQLS